MSPVRILVSNDDGIDAPGISILANAMQGFGEVYVVAPDREKSGAGHSLTLYRPLRILQRSERWYAVDGTPTDCVTLALKAIMKKNPPQLIVSGINSGPNLGDDITYSGTVSVALEGTILGVQSVAFSLAKKREEVPNYVPAAYFAQKVVKRMLAEPLPSDVLLNVNIPNTKGDKIEAFEWTRMGKRRYSDAIPERIDPRGKKYYWIGGDEMEFDSGPGSDGEAIKAGKVSITPVRLDLTHDLYLERFRNGWSL
jgi:5'-nucleotidase